MEYPEFGSGEFDKSKLTVCRFIVPFNLATCIFELVEPSFEEVSQHIDVANDRCLVLVVFPRPDDRASAARLFVQSQKTPSNIRL